MAEWRVSAALRCGMGRVRHNNEDAYYFNGAFPTPEDMDEEKRLRTEIAGEGTLWAVCDGMGGMASGEVASQTAVESMRELQRDIQAGDFATPVQRWAAETDRRIMEKTRGGGCTVVMLAVAGNLARIAHIGDSRIYRFHEDRLERLTEDHSKVGLLVRAGIITEEEARTHPQRHVITRALGLSGDSECDATIGKAVILAGGDRFLLCSDGVTDMLTDEEIEGIFRLNAPVEETAETIYAMAMESGGVDNTTVLVLETDTEDQTEEDSLEAGWNEDYEDDFDQTLDFAEEETENRTKQP